MVHVIAKETGIAEDIIIDDFREVYREHESIEYGPSVQELAICRTMSDSEVEHLKNLARTVFGQVGRKHLRPYDGVRETLLWATKVGLLIVCSTNAPINLAEWRLRQLGLISYFYGLAGRIPVGERRYEPYSRARMIWQLKSDELKPFTSGYRRIIADLSLKVSDLYVVGDNLEKDVRPAMQLGAVGIWARYGKSYQQKNLHGINLQQNDLTGWDFSTGGVKCLAFDLQGSTLAAIRLPTDLWTQGGVSELNLMQLEGQARASVRLGTLNNLRWLAVVGQATSLVVVRLILDLDFPVLYPAAVIGASALLNVILSVAHPSAKRLTAHEATAFLAYDIVQLAALLFFTGGIENPFALLFLAPVVVSAATLDVASTVFLGGLAFAMLYYIVPRIYGTRLYSLPLATLHFWLSTLGILFYAIPMYIAGITQSLMWRQFTADGALQYPNFLETVVRLAPMYALRVGGGLLFTAGAVVAVYNLYRTARSGVLIANEAAAAPPMAPLAHEGGWHRRLESRPVRFAVLTFVAVVIGASPLEQFWAAAFRKEFEPFANRINFILCRGDLRFRRFTTHDTRQAVGFGGHGHVHSTECIVTVCEIFQNSFLGIS
jgi:FMN phosphatase YigB (HAD superfamily)